ncbi:hypothetical protein M3M39_02590 [Fructilactobacillus hinvesii]|uniref:Uncharacterized protein n=1 Tax=Fructilactobacillus hinvesii TaxID=2940300 RepID=A0ABY5BXB6_9LACO|nr:hypothetical protein [Fructilactobacillus hinvesii]USS88384.1 hypothetical protein M3M39_02590 [Fructilactobacillus hinvesii]
MPTHFRFKIGLTLVIYLGLILALNFFHRLMVPHWSRSPVLMLALPLMWLVLTIFNHFYLHQPLFYYHQLTPNRVEK